MGFILFVYVPANELARYRYQAPVGGFVDYFVVS
jgi:hypothetical protein